MPRSPAVFRAHDARDTALRAAVLPPRARFRCLRCGRRRGLAHACRAPDPSGAPRNGVPAWLLASGDAGLVALWNKWVRKERR